MNEGPTNLILVVVDALRKDRVGVYEESPKDSLTPNIDELAQEGAIFTNAYTASNVTDASVTSMHTGHYPRSTVYHHADLVTDEEQSRVEQVATIPEQLRADGWKTISVAPGLGRWHKNGFDFFGPKEPYLPRIYSKVKEISPTTASFVSNLYRHFRLIAESIGQSDDSRQSTSHLDLLIENIDDSPFYGFIRLLDTHIPYTPPDNLIESVQDQYEYPDQDIESVFTDAPEDGFLNSSIRPWLVKQDLEAGLSRVCARYDASVIEADRKIGYLEKFLKKRGQWEDTALIICGDHGESIFEHGIYMDHHGLYDETMHVPLIVKAPNTQGTRHENLVQLPDIAPTIADLLGIDASLGEFGKSLAPLLEDGEWEEREIAFAEEAFTQRRVAVRSSNWKYIQHIPDNTLPTDGMECRYCKSIHGPPPELYDLRKDPNEKKNVIESNKEKADELKQEYTRLVGSLPSLNERLKVEYEDEEKVLEQLKDLGYK